MYKLFDKLTSCIAITVMTAIILNNLYFYDLHSYREAEDNQKMAQKTLDEFLERYKVPKILEAVEKETAQSLLEDFLTSNRLCKHTYMKISQGASSFSSGTSNLRNKGIATFRIFKGNLELVIEVWVGRL
ncbi:MAG: hypothetical protein ACUVQ8_01060 [Nitrososphaeria archaeon]